MSETYKARIIEDVVATAAKDGASQVFEAGHEGRVVPGTVLGHHGNPCFRWLESWWDGFGGVGDDTYFVPAGAVEWDEEKVEKKRYEPLC